MTEDKSHVDRRVRIARRILVWSGRIVALVVIALSVLVAVFGLMGAAPYLAQTLARATTLDMWFVLLSLQMLFALAVVVGVGFALRRRKLLPALVVSVLAWPMGTVIEGARCDTEYACQAYGWAAPPAGLFNWSVRIRPVTDRLEVEHIASAALDRAGSRFSVFEPRRFGDYWLAPTINEDGWAQPNAVKVDVRTGETAFVPCPADRMQRPVVSEGRRVFRDAHLRLSAIFPAGMPVCSSWTYEQYEPWGFHAIHRPVDKPCEIVDRSRTLGVAVVEAPLPDDCLPLPEASLRALGGRTPILPGHASRVCQETSADHIAIIVRTAVQSPAGRGTATTDYEAYLLTSKDHLAEDARAFMTFLQTVRVGKI